VQDASRASAGAGSTLTAVAARGRFLLFKRRRLALLGAVDHPIRDLEKARALVGGQGGELPAYRNDWRRHATDILQRGLDRSHEGRITRHDIRRGRETRCRNLFDFQAAPRRRLEHPVEFCRRSRRLRFPDDGGDARGAPGGGNLGTRASLPVVKQIQQDRRGEPDAEQHGGAMASD